VQRMRTVDDRRAVLALYGAWLGGYEPGAMPGASAPLPRPITAPGATPGTAPIESDDGFVLQPHYAITRSTVQVGSTWLARCEHPQPSGHEGRAPHILHAQLRPLEALMTCIRMRWMCILVGEAGAGKTSLARLLARLAGRPMAEVTLSTTTDTTELLGCFEQNEPSRVRLAALRATGTLVAHTTQALLLSGSTHTGVNVHTGHCSATGAVAAECISVATRLQAQWAELAAPLGAGGGGEVSLSDSPQEAEWSADRLAKLEALLAGIEHAGAVLTYAADAADAAARAAEAAEAAEAMQAQAAAGEPTQIREPTFGRAASSRASSSRAASSRAARAHESAHESAHGRSLAASLPRRAASVRRQLREAAELVVGGARGRFVWVDGPLVTAMEEGSWLLLDNANLCNPSVLDRLNPLLERHGVLQLPECGLQSDGSVRELQAHPDFRLLMTVDPMRGELSRAMRNRGVEVSLMPLHAQSRDVLGLLCAIEADAPPEGS